MAAAKKPSFHLEVFRSLSDEFHFVLRRTRTKRGLLLSRAYPSLDKCLRALKTMQAKKIIDPHLTVRVRTEYRELIEMWEEGL